jgi:hypothetical protein
VTPPVATVYNGNSKLLKSRQSKGICAKTCIKISLHLKWCRNCCRSNLTSTNQEWFNYFTIPRSSFWKIKVCYSHIILHLLSRELSFLPLQPATCPGNSSNVTSVKSYSKTRAVLIEAVQLELCIEELLPLKWITSGTSTTVGNGGSIAEDFTVSNYDKSDID